MLVVTAVITQPLLKALYILKQCFFLGGGWNGNGNGKQLELNVEALMCIKCSGGFKS